MAGPYRQVLVASGPGSPLQVVSAISDGVILRETAVVVGRTKNFLDQYTMIPSGVRHTTLTYLGPCLWNPFELSVIDTGLGS